jgi:hypothetical protein
MPDNAGPSVRQTRKVERGMPSRAAELVSKIEADLGDEYALASARSEAFKKAADLFAADGDPDQAARCRIEWLVFAFRETEAFGSSSYFGPRYTKADGTAFPDFYALPPNTQQYLKARMATTTNAIHRARYADFLWDKFRDADAGAAAVPAYIDSSLVLLGRADGNNAFRAIRRACHLAKHFRKSELLNQARDASVAMIERMAESPMALYIPRVSEALMGLAEALSPDQRRRVADSLERARQGFVQAHDYHIERATLKSLRQLYKLVGDEEGERKAWLGEGESYEAEGDYKLQLTGSGSGPEVASHLYQLALSHFVSMGEQTKIDALAAKLKSAHKRGPANFAAFVENLRGVPGGQNSGNT